MYIVVTYTYYTSGLGYIGDCAALSSTNARLVLVVTDPMYTVQSSPVTQTCVYSSDSARSVYDGIYNLQAYAYDCTTTDKRTCTRYNAINNVANVSLSYNMMNGITYDFGTYIQVFSDNGFSQPQGRILTEGKTICFQDVLNIGIDDLDSYKLSINTAYLCSPDRQTDSLNYDGVNTFGCMNVSASTPLIVDGSVDPSKIGSSVKNYYNPVIYSFASQWKTGFCINAMSRFMHKNGTLNRQIYKQYIQLSLKVVRTSRYNSQVPTDASIHHKNLSHVIKDVNFQSSSKVEYFEREGNLNGLTFFVLHGEGDKNTNDPAYDFESDQTHESLVYANERVREDATSNEPKRWSAIYIIDAIVIFSLVVSLIGITFDR
jgi:hypothetical protein